MHDNTQGSQQLRAHGRVGQAQTRFGGAFAKANTKKRRSPKDPPPPVLRAGKKPPNFQNYNYRWAEFPPTPLPPARSSFRPPPVVSLFVPKKRPNFFVNPAQFQKSRIFGDDFVRIFPQPKHFLPCEAEVRHAKACSAE